MSYTDNPLHDFFMHEQEKEEWLKKQPKCCECKEHIQDEQCFEFDGKYICENCMDKNHKKWTEDLVGE